MFSGHSASSGLQLHPLIAIADEHVPSRDLGRSRVATFSGHSASSGLQLRPLIVIADEHAPSRDLGRSRVATFSGHSASSSLQLRPLIAIADEHVPLIANEHVPSQDLGRSRVATFSGHSASSSLQLRPLVVIADEHAPCEGPSPTHPKFAFEIDPGKLISLQLSTFPTSYLHSLIKAAIHREVHDIVLLVVIPRVVHGIIASLRAIRDKNPLSLRLFKHHSNPTCIRSTSKPPSKGWSATIFCVKKMDDVFVCDLVSTETIDLPIDATSWKLFFNGESPALLFNYVVSSDYISLT
ncbi:hypothetical protein B0O80DRAFT_429070 [Mortierella sp. GBAus27b]|nr:hypothetical protein B0O80DRAFT_429070 [Mortierella sp. GBAus27b]